MLSFNILYYLEVGMQRGFFILYVCIFLSGCSLNKKESSLNYSFSTFQLQEPSHTGISFVNQLNYTEKLNTYTYRNFYNGAGVALGDINNDGLIDIYFTGNMVNNKLYLNKGNFEFEDITEQAGVACKDVWSTGVSFADINGDGLLDIYVCKSGPPGGVNRYNQLFINNGDLTFTERAKEFGVDDRGLSTHAVFFDFDKDGDLDFYLLNNSLRSIGIYDLREGQREIRDPDGGNKLYRNDGNKFTEISEEAGIYGSAIGFGLGVTVTDINKDGWEDLFVSNDFFERDYLYINQKNGTFLEAQEKYLKEISMGSMGADVADLNNDGLPEIYVTEMLPESWERIKTKTIFEDWDKYQSNIANGYHHQFTRNALQLNNGPVPGKEGEMHFSEISRFSGMHATDWSWGALIFDFDNDKNKDVFVANGIGKDLTDQDYINFYANNNLLVSQHRKDSLVLTKMVDKIPSQALTNYLFKNNKEFSFENIAEKSGLSQKSFSNGAAYGDMDNDGDLDLVVNNINQAPFIYRNNSRESEGKNFLKITLRGEGKNTAAIGSQVSVYINGEVLYQEQNPMRGYMSTVDQRLNFGVGEAENIDSLIIKWPSGKISVARNIASNQSLIFSEREGSIAKTVSLYKSELLYVEKETQLNSYRHIENNFVDFNRDRLLFEMVSNEGPAFAKGDVNGDGLEDYYFGGAKGQPGAVYIQTSRGDFIIQELPEDVRSEDTDAVFFDADNDGDTDLYIASGGNEFSYKAAELKDRLYLNDGKGSFTKSKASLAGDLRESTAFVRAFDYDSDGDLDLLVGSRLIPFYYGLDASAYLLENDGAGRFSDVTDKLAPELKNAGLLTDALTTDIDNDGDLDILIAGEWMPIRIFENKDGIFEEISNHSGLENHSGLWNSITAGDFNNDGLIDFVTGNTGLNTRYVASDENPLCLFINDFDSNGSVEHIICQYDGEKTVPIVLLQDLSKQIPSVRKKYQTFDKYKSETLTDIFNEEQLKGTVEKRVTTLETTLFLNQGNNSFKKAALPKEAQFTKTYALKVSDINNDGISDIILAGNQSRVKPEMGTYMAGYGLVLIGNGNGSFTSLKASESGIFVEGEVRQIEEINLNNEKLLLFIRNNDQIKTFSKNNE